MTKGTSTATILFLAAVSLGVVTSGCGVKQYTEQPDCDELSTVFADESSFDGAAYQDALRTVADLEGTWTAHMVCNDGTAVDATVRVETGAPHTVEWFVGVEDSTCDALGLVSLGVQISGTGDPDLDDRFSLDGVLADDEERAVYARSEDVESRDPELLAYRVELVVSRSGDPELRKVATWRPILQGGVTAQQQGVQCALTSWQPQ